MKTLLPLVLPLLLVACKSSQQTTQQVLHTQQTDSLALYKQRLQEQRIQLDQWQELEWELSQSPGDTLPCLPNTKPDNTMRANTKARRFTTAALSSYG